MPADFTVVPAPLEGVLLITPPLRKDERGWFSETFRAEALAEWGVRRLFVQDNQAFTKGAGYLRGLHFQAPPSAQSKLIRVIRGAIFDVAVDIRSNSPTFGSHFSVEISAADRRQIYIPAGFAHGYVTLGEETDVAYKVDNYYDPATEGGLAWNDAALAIDWPDAALIRTSNKDKTWPPLSAFTTPF